MLRLGVGHPDHHLLAALLPTPTATLGVRLAVPSVLRRAKLQIEAGFSTGPTVWLLGRVGVGEMGPGSVLGELGEHIFASSPKLVATTGGRSLSSLLAT